MMRASGLLLAILTALEGQVCRSWFVVLHFGSLKTHLLPTLCTQDKWSDPSWFHHRSAPGDWNTLTLKADNMFYSTKGC